MEPMPSTKKIGTPNAPKSNHKKHWNKHTIIGPTTIITTSWRRHKPTQRLGTKCTIVVSQQVLWPNIEDTTGIHQTRTVSKSCEEIHQKPSAGMSNWRSAGHVRLHCLSLAAHRYVFDHSNAVQGETFTTPHPKKKVISLCTAWDKLCTAQKAKQKSWKAAAKNCQQSHKKWSRKPPQKIQSTKPLKVVKNYLKRVWACVGMCGYVRACVGVCRHVWAYVGMCGHAWACIGLCGNVWDCFGIIVNISSTLYWIVATIFVLLFTSCCPWLTHF